MGYSITSSSYEQLVVQIKVAKILIIPTREPTSKTRIDKEFIPKPIDRFSAA
jgi:hypothetical protein